MQELIARGVCIQDANILLAYYRDKDYFFLPGGHVEEGESVIAALGREIKEELDLDVSVGNVVSVFEHAWDNGGRPVHEINFLITFSLPPGAELVSHVEHLDFRWVSAADFNTIRFLPEELKDGVGQLLSGHILPAFGSSL